MSIRVGGPRAVPPAFDSSGGSRVRTCSLPVTLKRRARVTQQRQHYCEAGDRFRKLSAKNLHLFWFKEVITLLSRISVNKQYSENARSLLFVLADCETSLGHSVSDIPIGLRCFEGKKRLSVLFSAKRDAFSIGDVGEIGGRQGCSPDRDLWTNSESLILFWDEAETDPGASFFLNGFQRLASHFRKLLCTCSCGLGIVPITSRAVRGRFTLQCKVTSVWSQWPG